MAEKVIDLEILEINEIMSGGYKFVKGDSFDDETKNTLSQPITKHLKDHHIVPDSAEIFVPCDDYVTASWTSPGWICIHEFPFRAGLRIPCNSWISGVLSSMKLAPCQIMPSMWKVICLTDKLCTKYRLQLTVQDLKNVYSVRAHGRGRFIFRIRKGQSNLIELPDTGDDKDWKTGFLFLKSETLGNSGCLDYPIGERADSWQPVPSEDSKARIAAFMALPLKERTWSEDDNKTTFPTFCRPAKKGVKVHVPMVSAIKGETSRPYTRGRLNPTLLQEKMDAILAGNLDIKPQFIPTGVPTPGFRALKIEGRTQVEPEKSTPDKKTKKRKADEIEGLSLPGTFLSSTPSTGVEKIIQQAAQRFDPDLTGIDTTELAFRATHSALQTLDCISSLGHILSTSGDRTSALEDRLALKEQACTDLEKALDSMKEVAEKAKTTAAKSEEDLASSRSENESLQARVQELEGQLQNQETDLALFYTAQTRIQMMRAPESEREEWDVDAAVAKFKQLFPGVPVPGEETAGTDQEESSAAGDGGAGEDAQADDNPSEEEEE